VSTPAAIQAVLDQGGAVTGQTFTLTTGSNNFTGTAGNDTFDGGLNAANMTFGNTDSLDGGAGTDTLTVAINAIGTYQAASLKNIENINVVDTSGQTLSLLGATGVESVTSLGSTAATTVTNIGSAAVKLGVTNSAAGATFTYSAAAVQGTADETTLTLNGQTACTNVVNGIETLNIVSTGAANALTALTANQATTLKISGDATLNLGAANTVATSITSTNTAGVTLTSNNAAAVTISGGDGNDAFTLIEGAAAANNVSGGAGNDSVTFTANLDTVDTVAGGDGVDTLVAVSADLAGQTYTNVSGFERLTVSNNLGGNLATANIQAGIERVNLAGQTGGNTITFEAGAKALDLAVDVNGAINVADTGTATTDSLTITNQFGELRLKMFNYAIILFA